MTPRRKRLFVVLGILGGVSAAVALAVMASRENIMFYYDPTQIAAGKAPVAKRKPRPNRPKDWIRWRKLQRSRFRQATLRVGRLGQTITYQRSQKKMMRESDFGDRHLVG